MLINRHLLVEIASEIASEFTLTFAVSTNKCIMLSPSLKFMASRLLSAPLGTSYFVWRSSLEIYYRITHRCTHRQWVRSVGECKSDLPPTVHCVCSVHRVCSVQSAVYTVPYLPVTRYSIVYTTAAPEPARSCCARSVQPVWSRCAVSTVTSKPQTDRRKTFKNFQKTFPWLEWQ
jgi:hypothetical protein